jgi:glycine cleavage system H protein
MAADYLEFSIVSDRKYTRNHLWMQLVDKEEGTWKIGVSDCMVKELGEILRVVPAEVDDEFSEDDVLFSLRASDDRETFHSPCAGKVIEVNNELEGNPELVSEDTYSEGWILLIDPHDFDADQLLTAEEYIESLED